MTVFLAMLLDAVLGEPKWLWKRLPHPAVLMGRAIAALDKAYNRGDHRRRNGIFAMALLVAGAYLLGQLLQAVPGPWIDILLGAILIAHRSLIDHVKAVATGLILSLNHGRKAVALIVSRDVTAMDESAVARSAIESGAENLSDGVVAPVVWFALFGLPGLLIYKVTNTADSMIGYMTPRYRDFGWAAARLDDVLNWVPARLTALMIWCTDRETALWTIQADAKKHRSPNAGWPEAAMAYKHNLALSGPRSYDGKLTEFPFVNPTGKKTLRASDITATLGTMWQVWGLTLVLALFLALIAPG